jgi:hypothetical protein
VNDLPLFNSFFFDFGLQGRHPWLAFRAPRSWLPFSCVLFWSAFATRFW